MESVIDEKSTEEQFNDPNRISVGELHRNLYGIIKEVQQTKTRRLITRTGRVVAVLSPLGEAAALDNLIRTKAVAYDLLQTQG